MPVSNMIIILGPGPYSVTSRLTKISYPDLYSEVEPQAKPDHTRQTRIALFEVAAPTQPTYHSQEYQVCSTVDHIRYWTIDYLRD